MDGYGVRSPDDVPEPVIETPDLRVWRIRRPSAVCVVTFANYEDVPTLDRAGFGEYFLAQNDVDAVHVVCRGNEWYQYPDMPRVLAAIRAATAGSARLITYGSSMGGYAAIRFAGELGAAIAIAISPQYSLDRRLVPFEHRWRAEAERIQFLPQPTEADPPPAIIFHDAHGPDQQHVQQLARHRAVTSVAMPHAGHPAGAFLAEVGLLGRAILDILADRFDSAALVQEARRCRRQSGQYWATIAARQPRWRRRTQIGLVRRALQAVPNSQHYASRLAGLLYRSGALAEAETMYRRALAVNPQDPIMLFRYSRFLQRTARFAEAYGLARAAALAHPASDGLRRHLARLQTEVTPGSWVGWVLRWHDALIHRVILLAWRRGWPLVGRIERP